MRKFLVAAGALAFLMVAAAPGHAGDCDCPCPMMVKGAKTEVKNIDNGVVITVTASDTAAVKEIQDKGEKSGKGECRAGMKAGGCPKGGACGCQKKAEGGCPKMQQQQQEHKAGGCPMQHQSQQGEKK
jgi:hypothetical protein